MKKTVLNRAWQYTECAPGGGGEDLVDPGEGDGDEGLFGSGGVGGAPLDSGWARSECTSFVTLQVRKLTSSSIRAIPETLQT